MQEEARVLLKPGVDVGVLVGALVIDDQVQVELADERTVQVAQELEKLLVAVAVARQALADDVALQQSACLSRVMPHHLPAPGAPTIAVPRPGWSASTTPS